MTKIVALLLAPLAIAAGTAQAQTYRVSPTPGGFRMSGPEGTTRFRSTPMGGYRYNGPSGSGTIRPGVMNGTYRINHSDSLY